MALAHDGLPPRPHFDSKQIWGNPFDGEYFFITDRLEITPGRAQYVGDVANTIVYTGNSRVANQLETVELALDALNERMIDRAVQGYKPIVTRLFQELSLDLPNGLQEAINQRKPFRSDEPYGRVELKRNENKPGFGVNLSVVISVATKPEGDGVAK